MDKKKVIAEDFLRKASCDAGGYLYPSQINISKADYREVLDILAPFGKEFNRELDGASPVFQINNFGRYFIAMGGWTEKEKNDTLEAERHNDIIESSKKIINM